MPPWRTMCRSEDLRAADLWSNRENKYVDAVIQIADVRAEEARGDDGKKTMRPHLYFAKHQWLPDKPLKLNATNATTIQMLLGTDISEQWRGTAIAIYVTKVKSPKSGMVDSIRVHQKLPEQPKRAGAPSIEEQRAIAESERAEASRG